METAPNISAAPQANGVGTQTRRLLSFSEVRNMQRTKSLTEPQVPVEHSISLPLPTKRAGRPTYAFFAAPAMRKVDQPVEQGAPDRWWLLDAHAGRLIVYALCVAIPFSDQQWSKVTLPSVTVSLQEMRAQFAQIEELMNALAPSFFAGEDGDGEAKYALLDVLNRTVPEPLHPQYAALAPDFFAWLSS